MTLATETVGAALGFNGDGRHYYVYRDYAAGSEFISNGRELCNEGFFISLEAYDYHVFLDFREIRDDDYGTWGKLCQQLAGRGVASIDEEVKQIRYAALMSRGRRSYPAPAPVWSKIADRRLRWRTGPSAPAVPSAWSQNHPINQARTIRTRRWPQKRSRS